MPFYSCFLTTGLVAMASPPAALIFSMAFIENEYEVIFYFFLSIFRYLKLYYILNF